jgi:inhibitor of cysteine peptidase
MRKVKRMKWVIASAILVVILAIVGGYIYFSSSKTPAMIEVSENQQNVEIKNGQEFTIVLTSNPSTGYSWSLNDTYNNNVTLKISNEFIASSTEMIGAPGRELWVFKGVGIGSTKLSFSYARQGDDRTSQLNFKSFNIDVKQ